MASLKKAGCPEQTGCEFSPSVACGDSSLLIAGSSVFRPPKGLAPLCKGSWQGRQALPEGLWVSYRSGQPVTGRLLLHQTYNPSASHSLSTSPYTGEARGGRRLLVPSPLVLRLAAL